MDRPDIETYRINYEKEPWLQHAKDAGNELCAPIGAVLAVNALCDYYEELEKQRDRLSDLCDTWNSECDDYRADNRDLSKQLSDVIVQRDRLLGLLVEFSHALPSDEYMASQGSEPGPLLKDIRAAIKDHFRDATKKVETAVPAIVFYPAGSLGEEVSA